MLIFVFEQKGQRGGTNARQDTHAHTNCTFPSQYTTGCPPYCPCRRGNVRLSPASQSWSVSLSYATSQTGIKIQNRTHTNTDRHTHTKSFFNPTAILLLSRTFTIKKCCLLDVFCKSKFNVKQ